MTQDDAPPRRLPAAPAAADLDRLARIHGACFPDAPWDAAHLARLLAMPGAIALADTAGFIMLRGAADEAEVITIAVDPASRRRGAGRRLLAAALDAAARTGADRIFLEVAVDNPPAIALYRAFAFDEVARRRRYYRRRDGESVDALVFSKRLFNE
ncbi:ribosomal protein S18-alanine N-acetyltransferase [Zavarzinia compransoris]|uniref:ribosomal protein S18-alanine N-acetyltransferase n=1 Tax=Zavarzinia marina TaxID=2911065 RepID=UPI001F3BE27F|nr:ribosomal protein S18-alanine N-acetyltransferase [Zavarzinia marina]MCF4165431.1 ribosomal protein S18-alanine N-acetyltransferase [Zavarzinia marina]